MGAVEHTLSMNQAHTFFVTKHGKYTHQTVEFRITDEAIAVTSFHSTRSLLTKSKKVCGFQYFRGVSFGLFPTCTRTDGARSQ